LSGKSETQTKNSNDLTLFPLPDEAGPAASIAWLQPDRPLRDKLRDEFFTPFVN
jgi:hypothetical protein